MQKKSIAKLWFLGLILWSLIAWTGSNAQEAEYELAHGDFFGRLRRPPVSFPHEIHAESLEVDGCGICHHVQDDRSGKLVYVEGEEFSCKECHVRQKDNNTPALREAYHGNCTVCHRRLIKKNRPKTGPTTCGGCHIKH